MSHSPPFLSNTHIVGGNKRRNAAADLAYVTKVHADRVKFFLPTTEPVSAAGSLFRILLATAKVWLLEWQDDGLVHYGMSGHRGHRQRRRRHVVHAHVRLSQPRR